MIAIRFITLTCTACLSLSAGEPPDEDPAAQLAQAAANYRAGDHASAAALCDRAARAAPEGAAGARLRRSAHYNAACSHALLGRSDEAFAALDRALGDSWHDLDKLLADPDLRSLHADSRWAPIVQRCRANHELFVQSLKEPALREELLRRMKEDQRVRLEPDVNPREWMRIDRDNLAYIKKVIDEHGWPGRSMVGDDGALAAFLLVQHAASDLAFQKRCLELLTQAVEQNEATAAHMAYLTDRVLIFEGKPQRYGTQFAGIGKSSKLLPIENEQDVDARRREVGLPPLAEYVKQVQEQPAPRAE